MAVLLAYFLDPVVTWLEKWRIPRALGSLLMVLLTLALLAVLGWSLMERVDQFSRDWPKYRAPLRAVSAEFEGRLESLEARVSEIEPGAPGPRVVTVTDPHPVRTALLGRLEFPIRLFVRRDVYAFPGVFHARRKAAGVARHDAVVPGG